ncbi:cobalamin biosynthesis protein [Pseudomonas schmalbachii]|uniref:Cobalamin biosynthesis protein n=1 Tax=Pseudomonas schmalbachii TaxID=2816993 RepID=A0ABS3TVR4_9PSED|nr:cobalamin biosynthesis protein [Pseudomonas schmalbachii]MBO3277764.1 cobalamin biosynthesis protein [Pseudomonas schmalbachii]
MTPGTTPEPVTIAGLGCRRGCTVAELRELLEHSLQQLALPLSALDGLASGAHKREEAGMLQLAADLGLPLAFCSTEQLAAQEALLAQPSERVRELTGAASVAEAAALARAAELGGRPARLLCGKQRSAAATLAIARA